MTAEIRKLAGHTRILRIVARGSAFCLSDEVVYSVVVLSSQSIRARICQVETVVACDSGTCTAFDLCVCCFSSYAGPSSQRTGKSNSNQS